MSKQAAIITGATGVVGHHLAMRLAEHTDWSVFGVSRRPPGSPVVGVTYLEVDLTDKAATDAAIGGLENITHLFSAARFDHSTEKTESTDANTAMLTHLIDAVEASGQPLKHVHLVQGTKYYGSNLGPFRTPARESDPRSLQSNFYFEQEDLCVQRSSQKGWSWSASRPHGICDSTPPTPRSIPMVIAVYAAILRELGMPLFFPGTPENYRAIYQCTNTAHLAKAIHWMAATPECANQAFNIINGDYIRWCNLWPGIARGFGMESGEVRTVKLAALMRDKAPVWDRIVARHGLKQTPYAEAALWSYADFIFTPHWDMMSDMSKARQYGFHDVIDTEKMLHDIWGRLRGDRIIPPA